MYVHFAYMKTTTSKSLVVANSFVSESQQYIKLANVTITRTHICVLRDYENKQITTLSPKTTTLDTATVLYKNLKSTRNSEMLRSP